MDFFEYASIAAQFSNTLWVQLTVGALCFLIVFVFEAVALYTIAVREGYKNKWMAFIPFFNTYYIGVCAQKNRVFNNVDTKKFAIATAVFEFALFATFVLYYVACYLVSDYVIVNEVPSSFGITIEKLSLQNLPENLAWAGWIFDNLYKYVLRFLDLIYLLLLICLLTCFFQTYSCRRYLLFTIASVILPIMGILFFVVRNNKGINYREFIQRQQARQYDAYRRYQQQNYGSNPYAGNYETPYQNPNPNPPAEDPFGDFGAGGDNSRSSSPFEEFDDNGRN